MATKKTAPIPAAAPQPVFSSQSFRTNARTLSSVKDQITPPYIKPADLAKRGQFYITKAYERMNTYLQPNKEECVYFLRTVDTGETYCLTMTKNDVRSRLVDVVRAGTVGPIVLFKRQTSDMPGRSPTWVFGDALDPEVIALNESGEVQEFDNNDDDSDLDY